jgi:hypothetical protein
LRRYNPKFKSKEGAIVVMLGGDPNCGAFIGEYERRRGSRVARTTERAMIFVGHTVCG